MKLFKKGDLTFRYLILAVLGLTVLIVIALIFIKGSGYFNTKLKSAWASVMAIKPDFSKAIPK